MGWWLPGPPPPWKGNAMSTPKDRRHPEHAIMARVIDLLDLVDAARYDTHEHRTNVVDQFVQRMEKRHG